MISRGDREQQQAELLWRYIEELKNADNPEDVQFVAVTSGECGEVVGIMETAAEAYAAARAAAAPHCRREAIRQRLQAAISDARPAVEPATGVREARRIQASSWLAALLKGRSTGWAAATTALIALIWIVSPRLPVGVPRPVPRLDHAQAIRAMPALIAGRLEPQKAGAAWEHMRQCGHCFEIFEAQWRAARARPRRTSQSAPAAAGREPVLIAWGGPLGR